MSAAKTIVETVEALQKLKSVLGGNKPTDEQLLEHGEDLKALHELYRLIAWKDHRGWHHGDRP